MAITTFTELKAAVADWMNRTDLTAVIPDFIALAEATMQAKCKLVEFEATATITITAGVGTLPTDLVAMRSIYWDGDLKRPLRYITPDRFDSLRNESATPDYYTISGTTIRLAPSATGSAIATYSAKFSALSGAVASNSILANFPDAYLYGALVQGAIFTSDDLAAQKYAGLFGAVLERINGHNQDRKYAGSTLQVRVR